MSWSSIFQLLPPSVRFRIRNWVDSSSKYENPEKDKLRRMQRYKPGKSDLIKPAVDFVDAASFLSAYEQIFEKEIYDFNTSDKAPVIIDCGANIGLSILFWKRKYPNARITAFEPDPKVYKTLKSNIKQHGYTDTHLIPKGVWSTSGMLSFFQEGSDGGFITDEEPGTDKQIISIPVVRLKDYLNSKIDMLKIDIEGAEVEVLNDCREALGTVENLFIEYHSYVNREQLLDELLNIIRTAGFRFHIQPELVASRPFVKRINENGMDHRVNIFAYRT